MSTSGDYKQQHLIKMANQIASSIPTRDDIPGQISAHMRQFWTTEMLKTLREIAAETPDILSEDVHSCLLYTSPSPRDLRLSRMPSSA